MASVRDDLNRDQRRKKAIGAGVKITLDGVEYTLHVGELSALDASMLRRETGMSIAGLLAEVEKSPDIDIIAAIVWLCRRQAGERVTYAEVASQIGYDSDLATEGVPAPDLPPDPVRVAEVGADRVGRPEA